MKTLFPCFIAVIMLFSNITTKAQNGNKNVIEDEMLGHVFRPAQVHATDARINQLKLPDGFTISVFASGLNKPRMLEITPEGFVYITDRDAGTVTLLIDNNNDGIADIKQIVVKKEQMHGIDYYNGKLYLITVTQVFTADIKADGTLGQLNLIISNLPDGGQHANRTLHFGPDNKLYISAGSTCNSCDESNEKNATLLQANADGSDLKIYAKGLRNTIGFDWHPVTKDLWGFDHGIDWLGDDDQPEELNKIRQGNNYGWPYVYAKGKFDKHASPPNLTYRQYALLTTFPVMLYTAHAAPMNLAFYKGNQFPNEYQNDAFVTMHGSWNRKPPSGYRVVRIHYEEGKPTEITDFITGFYNENDSTMFARVCGLAEYKDGSLLIADDANGYIYRVSYNGNQPPVASKN